MEIRRATNYCIHLIALAAILLTAINGVRLNLFVSLDIRLSDFFISQMACYR